MIYERCRAWLARLRRRPDPGLVDYPAAASRSASGCSPCWSGFGLLLIVADIVNPVHHPSSEAIEHPMTDQT